jgi:diaminohydroxyphosphoribosylaminopyrimidine deaminase/5-amino-6-(5-phosphoribosylamino)uracil reductase
MRDHDAMSRAVALAAAGRRRTPPWPSVGAVLVRDGELVGEAATGPFPTGPHAEVAALHRAKERARGATAFVTLEPCAHHGNTPPCADALIEAGVSRVVVAIEDPDERVAGRGLAKLRAAGIEVVVGIGAAEVTRDLAAYLHHRRTGRPFVVAKVAQSLDARVAAPDGSSQWITSEEARADAHELRADSQAIVIGAGTALADRPALSVRGVIDVPSRAPTRVLLDARGRVPAEGPLFDTSIAPTLVVTTDAAPPNARDQWAASGAKVEVVARAAAHDAGSPQGVDLGAVFGHLGQEGVLQAMVEGGPTLLQSVLAGGHARRLVAYVAPLVIGRDGRPAFSIDGPRALAGVDRFALTGLRRLGPDVRLDYDLDDLAGAA